MFYSENFVKRGIIYRYLIVEYPRYSVKQGGAAFTVLLKNQLTEKKKSADRVVYFRKTGDSELCKDRTFGLVHFCIPSI